MTGIIATEQNGYCIALYRNFLLLGIFIKFSVISSLLLKFSSLQSRSSIYSIFPRRFIPFGGVSFIMICLSILISFDRIRSFQNFTILFPIKTSNLSETRKSSEASSVFMMKSDLESLSLSIWSSFHDFMVLNIITCCEGGGILVRFSSSHLGINCISNSHNFCFLECENVCRWFKYQQWYPANDGKNISIYNSFWILDIKTHCIIIQYINSKSLMFSVNMLKQ